MNDGPRIPSERAPPSFCVLQTTPVNVTRRDRRRTRVSSALTRPVRRAKRRVVFLPCSCVDLTLLKLCGSALHYPVYDVGRYSRLMRDAPALTGDDEDEVRAELGASSPSSRHPPPSDGCPQSANVSSLLKLSTEIASRRTSEDFNILLESTRILPVHHVPHPTCPPPRLHFPELEKDTLEPRAKLQPAR